MESPGYSGAKKTTRKHNSSDSDSDADTSTRKKRGTGPVAAQATKLERLMNKIDKPIELPQAANTKLHKERAPKEFNMNVQGSSAGAGSGEFHVYRAIRRKEYGRVKAMEENAQIEKEDLEYHQRVAQTREEEDRETAKKRAKRQKRKTKLKLNKQSKGADGGDDSKDTPNDGGDGEEGNDEE
ncbi:hypothetical protein SmJEL517_g03828 [Synchytrium microbalum]|uniref:DUF1168 domain-containing protein n=1 Tax=Synchytrium microbalum TaxID=1806994 RepID=A0A507C520_9FUNG|nr:uncharacterized protein SmJEL517_g03828 [Synchytrium microbalum]TPX33214.1 hypothetical protein SmJEL517_g03828 [Synchytrium microbalum]